MIDMLFKFCFELQRIWSRKLDQNEPRQILSSHSKLWWERRLQVVPAIFPFEIIGWSWIVLSVVATSPHRFRAAAPRLECASIPIAFPATTYAVKGEHEIRKKMIAHVCSVGKRISNVLVWKCLPFSRLCKRKWKTSPAYVIVALLNCSNSLSNPRIIILLHHQERQYRIIQSCGITTWPLAWLPFGFSFCDLAVEARIRRRL